eukprot:GHVR01119132.1.p1 GENE.GHVR01119132.1~~GHVR01119132.1.p1  ORF type:complete len:112 (-),score=23.43 GHVR01119132.1:558-893(-)
MVLETYFHKYSEALVDKIYNYTPTINEGYLKYIYTPKVQTFADTMYPNWDTTCTVVEDSLLHLIMPVIDFDFDINNLAGGAVGVFRKFAGKNNVQDMKNSGYINNKYKIKI